MSNIAMFRRLINTFDFSPLDAEDLIKGFTVFDKDDFNYSYDLNDGILYTYFYGGLVCTDNLEPWC